MRLIFFLFSFFNKYIQEGRCYNATLYLQKDTKALLAPIVVRESEICEIRVFE